MDETVYFYCTPPNRTVSSKRMPGRKNPMKPLTVAITCNTVGSSKLPRLFIGAARRPRCFGGKTGEQIGFNNESTPKGWMNTELFQNWVRRFSDKIPAENHHVLLLLDDASSHPLTEPLFNATLQMLPPNTAAYLQPQDADIIRQFKAQRSKHQTRHMLDCLEKLLERAEAEGNEC